MDIKRRYIEHLFSPRRTTTSSSSLRRKVYRLKVSRSCRSVTQSKSAHRHLLPSARTIRCARVIRRAVRGIRSYLIFERRRHRQDDRLKRTTAAQGDGISAIKMLDATTRRRSPFVGHDDVLIGVPARQPSASRSHVRAMAVAASAYMVRHALRRLGDLDQPRAGRRRPTSCVTRTCT